MIGLALKQKAEKLSGGRGVSQSLRRELPSLQFSSFGLSLFLHPNVRQTFPIYSSLSAVWLNVNAIREIGQVKNISKTPKSRRCDELESSTCARVEDVRTHTQLYIAQENMQSLQCVFFFFLHMHIFL